VRFAGKEQKVKTRGEKKKKKFSKDKLGGVKGGGGGGEKKKAMSPGEYSEGGPRGKGQQIGKNYP